MLSQKMKQEFVRFYNLPFPMTEYNFDYYVNLLDPYYDTKNKLATFNQYLSQYQNPEEGYFQDLNNTKNNILNLFLSKVSGETVISDLDKIDTNDYKNKYMERQQVYIKPNVGKTYLSIDLKKANFQSFKFMAQQLNNDSPFSKVMAACDSFEDFFKLTGSNSFFTASKSLRQFIFGNLNPKKQQKIQSFIMSNVVDLLKDNFDCIDKVSGLNSDEIVIELGKNRILVEKIKKVLKNDSFTNQFTFYFETFYLDEVTKEHSFYVKRFDNGKVDFKNVPKSNLCEVIKFIENKEVVEEDLMFIHDGRLAKFTTDLGLSNKNYLKKQNNKVLKV